MENSFCKSCQENHPVTLEYWYFSKGHKTCKSRRAVTRDIYHNKNKEVILEKQRLSYATNPEKAVAKREASKDKQKVYMAKYRKKNPEKIKKSMSEWRVKQGIEPRKKTEWASFKERYDQDIDFKIKVNLRNRMRQALKNKSKVGSAVELLGGVTDAIAHIEKQFHPNPVTGEMMTWDNHSKFGWNIDHIIPLASFNLENPEELAKVCHYSNLRPLWWKQNKQKSDKVLTAFDFVAFFNSLNIAWSEIDRNFFLLSMAGKNLYVKVLRLAPDSSCAGKNVKDVMNFFETEFIQQSHIITSMINNFFGRSSRVGARECDIVPVSPGIALSFMKQNHLMGYHKTSRYIGLRCGNEIVSVLGFKKSGTGVDISRFASLCGTSVAGGFSKLLSFLKTEIRVGDAPIDYIISFCDGRYSSGASYIRAGFEMVGEHIGFVWSDGFCIYNRLKCRANMDIRRLSEKEHAAELGMFKIRDGGQIKFILRLQK